MAVSIRNQLAYAQQEIARAMDVLKPSMPESGLEDACRQVKQAAISNEENCRRLEEQVNRWQDEFCKMVKIRDNFVQENIQLKTGLKQLSDTCVKMLAVIGEGGSRTAYRAIDLIDRRYVEQMQKAIVAARKLCQ
jgi:hypothetical protein